MEPHVSVTAVVTRPWGEISTHDLGTMPAWCGLPAAWKRMHKAMVLEDCGHYPESGDGWRVSFKSESFDEWHVFDEDVNDYSMCMCGIPASTHDEVYPS